MNLVATSLLAAFFFGSLRLFLSALFLAGLLGVFLLGGVLGERNCHGGESQRQAKHQRHQFLHFMYSPVSLATNLRRLIEEYQTTYEEPLKRQLKTVHGAV